LQGGIKSNTANRLTNQINDFQNQHHVRYWWAGQFRGYRQVLHTLTSIGDKTQASLNQMKKHCTSSFLI